MKPIGRRQHLNDYLLKAPWDAFLNGLLLFGSVRPRGGWRGRLSTFGIDGRWHRLVALDVPASLQSSNPRTAMNHYADGRRVAVLGFADVDRATRVRSAGLRRWLKSAPGVRAGAVSADDDIVARLLQAFPEHRRLREALSPAWMRTAGSRSGAARTSGIARSRAASHEACWQHPTKN